MVFVGPDDDGRRRPRLFEAVWGASQSVSRQLCSRPMLSRPATRRLRRSPKARSSGASATNSRTYGGSAISPPRTVEIRHGKMEPTTPVGSGTARRIALPLPGRLRNSDRNGGCSFPLFVADPRTVRSSEKSSRRCAATESSLRTAVPTSFRHVTIVSNSAERGTRELFSHNLLQDDHGYSSLSMRIVCGGSSTTDFGYRP